MLLGLGTWQVRRLAWKNGILADIARAEAGPPVPLHVSPAPWSKVVAEGRFRAGTWALVGTSVRQGRLGGQLVMPLAREGAPDVLVDRGWVPAEGAAPPTGDPGPVRVVGYVRPAESRFWFTPADDPAARRFHGFDPAAIGAALGVSPVAPFTLVALGEPPPQGGPVPARTLPRPSNNHLSYAVTWYGLAVALIGVVWVRFRRSSA